jgi:hypothetical protein
VTANAGANFVQVFDSGGLSDGGWTLALLYSSFNTVNVVSTSANAITAASIADNAIDGNSLATSAITKIQNGLSTLTDSGVRDAVGLASANLDTQLSAIDTAADTAATEATEANTIVSDGTFGNAAIKTAVEAVPTGTEAADAFLGRNIAGGSSSGRTVTTALQSIRNRVSFDVPSAGQFTVFGEDDTTPSWVGTYTTDAGAEPVTSINPA